MAVEARADHLRRLLRSEIAKPLSCIDQINTVIWQSFIDADEQHGVSQLVDALKQMLRLDPTLITAINRAAEGLDGDWFDPVYPALQQAELASAMGAFIDDAIEASDERLAALGVDTDQTSYWARLWMQPVHDGLRRGWLCLDFRAREGGPPACFARMAFSTADYPELLLRFLGDFCDLEIHHVEDRRKPVQQGPMFRYHPERMRVTRAYLKGMQPLQVTHGLPALTPPGLQALSEGVFGEVQKTHLEYPLADRVGEGGGDFMTSINREVNLAVAWLAYAGAGREIFDIPQRLADMFELSDCDDIQLSQVHTPFRAQYVHFGPREDLELAPGWRCDGAYVFAADGHMTVRLTAAHADPEELMNWRIRPEPMVVFKFEENDQVLDVGTAVDTAVARQLGELKEEAARTPDMQEAADTAREALGLAGGVKVVTAERAERERDELLRTRDVGHRALSLVVNALCYLTAYPDDVEHRWPEAAPPGLVEQLEGGTPGRRKRAEQQLHSEGFSRIRLCGRAFRAGAEHGSHADAGTVRSHWRRGHFRSQAYGQGRQLRKLVWIMPVLVNAATMTEDTQLPGHVYIVDANGALESGAPDAP